MKKKETPSEQMSCGENNLQCPYGQPRPSGSKGARTLIAIMIGLAAVFVIGFGGYAILLSVLDNVGPAQTEQSGDRGSQTENTVPPQSDDGKNPIGSGTDPDFTGLTFENQSAEQLTAKEVFQAASSSVAMVGVAVEDETYYSSGIVLTEDGYILTAAHAIGYSREDGVTVITADGKERDAVVVGFDSAWDVAVLKVDAENLIPASLAKEASLSVGDSVYAVTAAGEKKYNCALTQGIVSAVDRDLTYDSVSGLGHVQTDAAISVHGSGGALVNSAGQIVGMTISDAYLDDGAGYGLPIQRAETVIEGIIRSGYVPGKVRLGITGTSMTKSEAASYGVPQGVVILDIQPDSGFAGTGVQIGDILTELAGEPVRDMADVAPILKKHKPGEQVEAALYRQDESGDGHSFTVTVELKEDLGHTQK